RAKASARRLATTFATMGMSCPAMCSNSRMGQRRRRSYSRTSAMTSCSSETGSRTWTTSDGCASRYALTNDRRSCGLTEHPPSTGRLARPPCIFVPVRTTVGIVGLGLLGHAVASRLLAAGGCAWDVVGYDVIGDRVADLVRLGGRAGASVAEVAAAEVVCVILPSLASVEEVVLGPDGLVARGPRGQTVIQMSTISPALTRRLAAEVHARGKHFLDCPVSGTSAMVARGDGVVFVGGARAFFDRWRPLLDAVLPRPVYVGEPGQAMVLKLVANLLVALHSAAAAEALTMARRAGLDLDLVLGVLTSGAAGSRMLDVRGP